MRTLKPNPTWHELCEYITTATEEEAETVLRQELDNGARRRHLLRIYSRVNRIRADRERKELIAKARAK